MPALEDYLSRPTDSAGPGGPRGDRARADRSQPGPVGERRGRAARPGPISGECGWCVLPDGCGYVAMRTEMPGVTGEMVDWWFDWHPRDPIRYRIWHPLAHESNSVEPPAEVGEKPYWGTVHHPVEDIGIGTVHARIAFHDPEVLGFAAGALVQPDVAAIVGGFAGDDRRRMQHTKMIHVFLRQNGGVVLRSRFWLGAAIRPYAPRPLAGPAARLLNRPAVRRRLSRRPRRAPSPVTARRSSRTSRRSSPSCTSSTPRLTVADGFGGDVLRRDDPGYEAARRDCVWNARIADRFPDLIVQAADEQDVVRAIRLAARPGHEGRRALGRPQLGGLPPARRRPAARPLAPDELSLDAEARTAVVQPGMRGSELRAAARARALLPGRPLPGRRRRRVPPAGRVRLALADLRPGLRERDRDRRRHRRRRAAPCRRAHERRPLLGGARSRSRLLRVVTRFHLQLHPWPVTAMNSVYLYPSDCSTRSSRWAREIGPAVARSMEMMLFLQRPGDAARDRGDRPGPRRQRGRGARRARDPRLMPGRWIVRSRRARICRPTSPTCSPRAASCSPTATASPSTTCGRARRSPISCRDCTGSPTPCRRSPHTRCG